MFKSPLTQSRQVVKTFSSREVAGQAMDRLVLSGFSIAHVFLVGDGIEVHSPTRSVPLSNFYGTLRERL